jgi:hypothetical protein
MRADPIKAEYFYKNEKEKTKLNWFCYEYAFELYTEIEKSSDLNKYRKRIGENQLVSFCVYFSKAMKKSIYEKLNGFVEVTIIYEDYITNFDQIVTNKEIDYLLNAAGRAWDQLLSMCEICPNRCISERHEKSILFDKLDEDGFLI